MLGTNIKNILYCTDLSDSFVNSFGYAVFLSKSTNANIHILHVVEPLSNDAKIALKGCCVDLITRQKMLEDRVEISEKLLKDNLEYFWGEMGFEYNNIKNNVKSSLVTESHPVKEILEKSKSLEADIIIMGTHTKESSMNTLLGSVVKSVLRRTNIPTMVIPAIK